MQVLANNKSTFFSFIESNANTITLRTKAEDGGISSVIPTDLGLGDGSNRWFVLTGNYRTSG